MDDYDTIILYHCGNIIDDDSFSPDDEYWFDPEEVDEWPACDREEALNALRKRHNTYRHVGHDWYIDEYALEYVNELGEHVAWVYADTAEDDREDMV